jgi:DNA mismatch endonuclease, patch repair protein
MVDVVDSATRSRMMSGIRAKNTRPEVLLRRALTSLGARYRIHPRNVPGRPDIAFPRARLAILVQGCFWHGCPKHYRAPVTRSDFWAAKLAANRARDARVKRELGRAGWRSLWLWEHDVMRNPSRCAARILTLRARILAALARRPSQPPLPREVARRFRSARTRVPVRQGTRNRPGRTGTGRLREE